MKLLIVEDEPSLREIMVRTLRGERYVVEEAADYASALAKLEDYDYDCILLDIMLPGGSGLRLLERLKELRKSAGVIIISARDSLDDKVEGPTPTWPSRSTWPSSRPASGASSAATSATVRRASTPATCASSPTGSGSRWRAARWSWCARSTTSSTTS